MAKLQQNLELPKILSKNFSKTLFFMNSEMIISELMSLKKIKTKRGLATYLGVSEQNISDWIKRNSLNFKIILNKFPEVDANWLITGEGNMLKQPTITGGVAVGDGALNYSNSNDLIDKFINEIAEQRKVTQSIVEQNSVLLRMLSDNNNSGSK